MYYLKHYFDPDFDYKNLKPKETKDGKVDLYNFGYVQNVVRGQVIAEFQKISPQDIDKYDERFIFKEKKFPIGLNCRVDPKNENQLIALVNGYVYYDENGNISVKDLLNVRGNVDFRTGNIYFVNNIVIYGDVKTDFEVQGNSIVIKGVVQGAKITALNSIAVEGGVKGESKAILKAENNIRCRYVENATLLAKGSILVDQHCLHSNLYANKNVIVKGKLVGGSVYSGEKVLVEGPLGGGFNVPTSIVLGYDSINMYQFSTIEKRLDELQKRIDFLEAKYAKTKDPRLSFEIDEKRREAKILAKYLAKVGEKIKRKDFKKCAVIAKSEINPGVEISIGPAYYKVEDFIEATTFYLEDKEIALSTFKKRKR